MKKAFDQTVRDLKREVNKKVLKVPSIEQKVLDATSNEPWGPHGSLLADIAQATRNYHEYQIIMSIIWKRTNDTGKNWRHVYKALTVLEYLVAHGSERVIDDIREHAYQISTLSDFQYIDSSGRDQGNNVRKKSQSLVVLVNDKERIQEVREKAAANRDKYRSTAMGNMYRPGGYGDRFNDDRYEGRYGNRDDDQSGYGRDRDWGSRDDNRYGRYGDSYGRDGERYGRDGYQDDNYQGKGQSIDEYNYNSRSRSVDRVRDRTNEDEGQFSSRGSGAKSDDHSQDGSTTGERLDRKYSGQNPGAPPSYEDAVSAARSPTYSDRDGEASLPNARKQSSPPGASPGYTANAAAPTPPPGPTAPSASAPGSAPTPASSQSAVQHSYKEVDGFDEFDPRGSFSAAPTTSSGNAPATSGVEMDLLGSLSESFSSNSLALVPTGQPAMAPETNGSASINSGPMHAAVSSTINDQPFGDPFGDGPFKAVPSTESALIQPHITTPTNTFNANSRSLDVPQPAPQKAATDGGSVYGATHMPLGPSGVQPPTNSQFPKQESLTPNQEVDILADILPPSTPSSFVNTQAGYPIPHGDFPPETNLYASQSGISPLTDQNAPQNSFQAQTGQPAGFPTQLGQPSLQTSYSLHSAPSVSQTGFLTQTKPLTFPAQAAQTSQMALDSQSGSVQSNAPNTNFYGTYNSVDTVSPGPDALTMQHNPLQSGSAVPIASQMGSQAPQVQSSSMMSTVSTNPSSGSAAMAPQSSKDKFEPKSTIWADTLSRGLVNLNISGPKANPLADIGVDFETLNRKEKRMEKPTTATVTSAVAMGKAMGSGSGMGRAGATVMGPPPNPMMGSGMNIGMAGGPSAGIGMGGYRVSQPVGRGMGMGMGMNMAGNIGMGMNVQQQMGFPPGSNSAGGYKHMMGTGNYGQQPHGGGYR